MEHDTWTDHPLLAVCTDRVGVGGGVPESRFLSGGNILASKTDTATTANTDVKQILF